ncbi:MAG: DUF6544 family protein [Gemmatimonadales bacterium]
MRIAAVILLVVLAVLAVVIGYGALRWNAGTRALRSRLEGARTPVRPRVVDAHELEGLPAPVQRYFRTVLTEGRPMVTGARLRHAGTFNMGDVKDRWVRFTSDQRIITRRPGFDWDARMRIMPGLTVRVHDAYVAGEGLLHAAVLGVIPVADLRGTREMAEGELLRFLAEGVWYPTALLPSQGVRWEAVDARSARATLVDGAITVTLAFGFRDDGMIETVRAEARGRAVGGRSVPTPWQGRFWSYQLRDGMRIPLDGEVAWVLPDGLKPYWRGHIVDIQMELAGPT